MNSSSELIQILKNEMPYLRTKYSVSSLKVFGSVARDQNRRSSDIDILISFLKTPTLFTLIRIENYLYQKMKVRTDLIMEDNISPAFQRRIAKDIISVWEENNERV